MLIEKYKQCVISLREVNVITQQNQVNKQAQRMLTRRYPQLLTFVTELTNFLDQDVTCRERLYCIMHSVVEVPLCRNCGKRMTFNHQKNRFNEFCQNKVGASCGMSTTELKSQIKHTIQLRYGVDNPQQNANVKQKRVDTTVERYGVESVAQLDKHRSRLRDYVVENRDDVNAKRTATMQERYGRNTYAQTQLSTATYNVLTSYTNLSESLKDFSKTDLAAQLGIPMQTVHGACKRLNVDYTPPKSPGSSQQQALMAHILQCYSGEVVQNARGVIPLYDLDIYIPAKHLAVEYNGIYFHGETKNRGKDYHRNKLALCGNKGLRLLQVWSSEWLYKKDIVKSRIASALGSTQRIHARKCTIAELPASMEREFLTNCHIQGYVPSAKNYTLMYDNQIVAMMTFIQSRYNKNFEWELLRYTNAIGITVVGGASRLFQAFIRECSPSSVISYCDLRWGSGNMYEKLGFVRLSQSTPNYFYFNTKGDTNKLFSRQVFQKHKLEAKLSVYDPALTEWGNMQANGYDRIWDCGNGVYTIQFN